MTLPFERTNALKRARSFLIKLLDPKETPRVPLEIRKEARALLKHYPWDLDLKKLAKKCPEILGEVHEDD
jgi:hypothetical protein